MRTLLLLAFVIAFPLPALAATPQAAPAARAAPAPETGPEAVPEADPEAFSRGAKAWAENCVRCHSLHDPKDLTDRQWKVVMTHMRLRAGLDGKQVRDITLFLQGSN